MLCLTRKEKQQIQIGDDVVVTVESIRGNRVRLSVTAPRAVTVLRAELRDAKGGDDATDAARN